MKIVNVAIYCRVSTEEQKKFGISVKDQQDSLTRYCEQNDLKIYDYYIDEGVSAATISKRKEFVRLLRDLDNIDLIIFTKLDRFSRNVRDANNILVELDAHNTAFRAIDEDDIDTSTADGRFIFNLKVNLAEHEKNKDSERINRINTYKYNIAKTVCTGQAPYGYKISEEKKLIVDEEKAKNIIALFEYYAKTNNLNETANWFRINCENKSTYSIKKYLRNSAYVGKFVRKKTNEIIDDYSPRIMSDELFNDVQKLIKVNVKKSKANPNSKKHNEIPYIFSGLLICQECGHILSGKTNSNSKHYYNCRYHYFKKCNNEKCINEKRLEKYLINEIVPILEKRKLEIIDINSNEQKIIDNSQKLKNKLKKLADLYLNDLIDLDFYQEEYNKINFEINKIKEQKENNVKLDYSYIDEFLKQKFLEIYDNLDNLEKRRLWSSIIESIEIRGYDSIKINVY